MDTRTLVDSDIEKGKGVLKALDKGGVPVTSAFWRYMPESTEWRLMVATPLVERDGPRAGYEAVEKAVTKYGGPHEIPLSQMSVVSSTDPFVRLIRTAVKTAPKDVSGIRFTNNVINNVLVEDVYIYRSA